MTCGSLGAESLAALARDLRTAGAKGLRKELFRGMTVAAKPLGEIAKAEARDRLPRKGGLNEVVAGARVGVRTRASGRSVGVRLTGARTKRGGKIDLAAIDRGRLRHPVYGNRRVWVTQQVSPGWWSESLAGAEATTEVRRRLVEVIDEVRRKLATGGH